MGIPTPMNQALAARAQAAQSAPPVTMADHMKRLEAIYGPGTQQPGGYTVFKPAPIQPTVGGFGFSAPAGPGTGNLPIGNLGQIALQNYQQTGDPFRSLASMQASTQAPAAAPAPPPNPAAPTVASALSPLGGQSNALVNNILAQMFNPSQNIPQNTLGMQLTRGY